MKVLTLLIILAPLHPIFSQDQNQAAPLDVESHLLGNWKLKGSEVDSRYEFIKSEKGSIDCQIHQYLEKGDDEITEIVHDTSVTIVSDTSDHKLLWETPQFEWGGRLLKITKRHILLQVNGKVLTFVRE